MGAGRGRADQKARPRVVAALKTRPPHTAAITYYVPAALHTPLSALLASVVLELGGRPVIVHAAPPLPPAVADPEGPPRVVAALKTRPPHTAAITYYVPAALHAPLSAQLASVVRELGGRPPVTVEPLPQVPGVTYLPAGGDAG